MQNGTSNLWLQQQPEADVQALTSCTAALQPLFLQIAACHPDGPTADAALYTAAEDAGPASQESTSTSNVQYSCSSGSASDSSEQGREDAQEQLSWTAATASLRKVLQVMQQRRLPGNGVSAQQALAAFQNACYAGSQAQEPG